MAMHHLAISYLAPTAGIIAAAITVPLLLGLYFLKLRRRPARVSSTMLWESAVRDLQANVPFRMIRPSWLLLLQLLIIALFVLALARPAIELSGAGGERTIIAIDRSASMSARDAPAERTTDGPSTRLEHAKREAGVLAEQVIDAGGEVMLVSFAARPQVLTQFTRNRGLLNQTIDAIELTDQPVDFDRTVALLAAMTRGDASEEIDAEQPPRLVLISDGNLERRSVTGPTLPPDRLRFVRTGPAGDEPKNNFGIVALAARRDFDDPGLVRVFVRVQGTAEDEQSITLNTRFRGEVVDTASVTVPGLTRDEALDHITLGEAGHSFELRTNEPGLLVINHSRPDALPSDDAAAVALLPPAAARIAMVLPGPVRTNAEFALVEAVRIVDPERLDIMTAEEFEQRRETTGFFAGYDLVIFDRVRPERLPPIASLSFGAAVPIPGLRLVPAEERTTSDFAFWDRTHPVLRGVGLGLVQMDSPASLVLPTPNNDEPIITEDPTEDPTSEADMTSEQRARGSVATLASTPAGAAISLIERGGTRRLIVAPELEATTWWSDQSFPVFIVNAIEHLTLSGGRQAGRAYDTTNETRLLLPRSNGPVLLEPPDDGPSREITPSLAGLTSLGILPTAGVWIARAGEPAVLVPVNLLSPDESSIRTSDTLFIAGTEISADAESGTAPREIWPWLIMAAAILLALEWCLFALRSRI